ncbi:MAG TPA: hypothetical protein VFW96_24070, partial [Thermomicrobiales bacterium]|nr:hypothetical protein [Thermomicrobiales bacterium]
VAAAPPLTIQLQFTSDAADIQDSVATDGAVVAWLDGAGALYVHDLATGKDKQVLDGPARRSELALGGGALVWVERPAGDDGAGSTIRGLKLAGGDPFVVAGAVGRGGEPDDPAVAGDVVVWRDHRNGNWDIYGYDLAARREFPIVTEPSNQGDVAVAGTTVVWEDHRAGNWDLYGYDLTSRREFAITTDPDDETQPAAGDGVVAFVRQPARGGFGSLVLRDLVSGQEQTVTQGHLVARPALAGDLLVWEDWRDGLPNVYAYDRQAKREFALTRSEQARGPAVAKSTVAWLSKGEFAGRVTVVRLAQPLPSDPVGQPTLPDPDVRYFPETQHTLSGAFRAYWNANGGLATFGYPLTEAFEEPDAQGIKRKVQYFERAEFEADPTDNSRVLLARLGADQAQVRHFPPLVPFPSSNDRMYFSETQHSLRGAFKTYWEGGGGLAIFGYPLSEEHEEGGVVVQYFERARFELRQNAAGTGYEVVLGQLGREALLARGWLKPPTPTTQR